MNDSEFIKSIRKLYGMTQKEFADKFYTTRQTVIGWEKGKTLPPIVKMAIKLRAEKDGVDWAIGEGELPPLPEEEK